MLAAASPPSEIVSALVGVIRLSPRASDRESKPIPGRKFTQRKNRCLEIEK
jgi:hypothetical protein